MRLVRCVRHFDLSHSSLRRRRDFTSKMVKFTKLRDKLLIESVKQSRMLYDPGNFNSKNFVMKYRRWEEISEIVGAPVVQCRKRWKSLRDQYNKKRKSELNGVGTMSKWKYTDLLSFMYDTVSNQSEDRESNEDCDDYTQQIFLVGDEEQQSELQKDKQQGQQLIVDAVSGDDSLSSEDIVDAKNKSRATKRKSLQPITKPIAKRDTQSSDFNEKVIHDATKIKTPIQKFFESMSDTVDKLPTHLQAEIRLKVCQIVTEVEIKHHAQNSSLQSNDPRKKNSPKTTRDNVRTTVPSDSSD